MPLISVIMPAYNQSDYLGCAIQSVLDQTYQFFEIIVVDDGSTDNTRDVVGGFIDNRIRYIYQENRGLSGARNTGLFNAFGDLIAFLDSDDLFLPGALTLLASELKTNPQIGLVAGQSIRIDENGNLLGQKVIGTIPAESEQLLLHNPIQVCNVLVRREWIDKVGLFDESLRAYEDWDLWLRLAKAGCRMKSIENTVARYRVHQLQMTLDVERMRRATFAVLEKAYDDPSLPKPWRLLKDKAFSRAFLRTAGSASRVARIADFIDNLSEAIRLDPELLLNNAQPLARRFSAWSDDPRIIDKLEYLKLLYESLPEDLELIKNRKHRDLGQAAMRIAYQTYGRGDHVAARKAVFWAFRHQPQWLFNRGALSIFLRSWLKSMMGSRK